MKFNAYFVRLSHPEQVFSGTVQIAGENIHTGFKKVSADFFIAYFKKQVELKFKQELSFKNAKSPLRVLLPVLAQYNQRKLRKLAEILAGIEGHSFSQIVVELLAVENFLAVAELLDFFAFEKTQAVEALTSLEISRQVKLIALQDLLVTAWDHFALNLEALENALQLAYDNREKTLKFNQLEKIVKVPQTSIYFRYLLRTCSQLFPLKFLPNALIFTQLPLSADEKERMAEIEKVLRANKLLIFSIENVQEKTSFSSRQINDALWYMISENKFLALSERYYIFSDEYSKIINRLKKFKRNQGDVITIDELRTMTSFSRKYIIVLFEYLDRAAITQRVGSKRKIVLGA